MQTARLHLRMNASFAALAGIAMWFGLSPAGAQGTPEQRAACENDACGCAVNFGGDLQRITTCMSQKRRYLSPQCRVYFDDKRRSR